jgi:hypothetical protein
VYERLADVVGRGIRYGEVPVNPDVRSVVDDMQQLSALLREGEEMHLEELDRLDERQLGDSQAEQELRETIRRSVPDRRASSEDSSTSLSV